MWKVRRSRDYGREITGIAVRTRSPAGAVFGCFGEWCSATGGDFCCQRMGARSEDVQRDESAQGRLRLVRVQRDVSSRVGLRRLGTGRVARRDGQAL